MESDSSLENEETQQNLRDGSNMAPAVQNSDVSDDENFSRGAKSIESPPESPWGGANLDSPPASPAPRRSPESGSERARSPERPQTPDSGPESPQNSSSPCNFRNSAPSSPGSGVQSPKNGSGSRKSTSSEEGSRSSSVDNDIGYRPKSPQYDGPRSPLSDKPSSPNDRPPRSPSDKEGPQSPSSDNDGSLKSSKKSSENRSNYRKQHRNDSSDSDTTVFMNSIHSESDDDDRSWEDYRGRRKSNKRRSSGSSAGSGSENRRPKTKSQQDKDLDLSDVSDCDSLGPVSDEDSKVKDKEKNGKEEGEKTDLTMIDDSEQLDFEAEETDNKVENGDVGVKTSSSVQSTDKQQQQQQEEKGEEELEEGELSDEGEARPEETEPRPVCRFFSRGQCTWGSSCSYRHVGEGGAPPQAQNQKAQQQGGGGGTPVQHTPLPPMMQHGAPMMHHGAPMHHPPRFVPRPHGPPFFRRPLRPMFPRFVHPGVTDKGNYTMFEMVRPLVPMNAGGPPLMHGGPHGPPHHPPHHHLYPPHMDPYMRPPHMERPPPPMQMPPPYQHQQPVQRKEPDQSSESAWERGLRQAKEMIRKSSKRKETDADFEEKKMTMSGGVEGVDKENEFYSQAPHSAPGGTTSPYEEEHYSRYNKIEDRRLSREGYRERGYDFGGVAWGYEEEGVSPPPVHHRGSHRYSSRHHHQGSRDHHRGVDYDYYDERDERERDRERDRERERDRRRDGKERSRRKSRSYRDKQSPRESGHVDKQAPPTYDLSPSEVQEKRRYDRGRGTKSSKRGADDEWADPWMRSKSPVRKARAPRKPSYSSKSSFSSSSSSRSSSYSSYSRSECQSTGSVSSRSRSRSLSAQRRNKKRKTSPRRNKSPFSRGSDKRSSDVERSLHMNPPAPSPTAANIYSRLSPSSTQRRDRKEISARLLAAAMHKHKRSSSKSSSSNSDSSNSSDSSSSMSDTHSSSSSRSPSPTPLPSASHKSSRKKVLDEKLAQSMKVKAMDALKLSGQKQQIKLNLKGKDSLSERLQQMPICSSRKRPAESLPFDDGSSPPNLKMSKKSGPSRREELLKQLKAVEDAIARKRSKI